MDYQCVFQQYCENTYMTRYRIVLVVKVFCSILVSFSIMLLMQEEVKENERACFGPKVNNHENTTTRYGFDKLPNSATVSSDIVIQQELSTSKITQATHFRLKLEILYKNQNPARSLHLLYYTFLHNLSHQRQGCRGWPSVNRVIWMRRQKLFTLKTLWASWVIFQNRKAIKANYFSPSLFEQFSPLSVNQARQTIFRTVINNTVKCRILNSN